MVGDRERYCGDVLRNARAAVLRDAEALPDMLFAQERVGAIMTGKSGTLLGYQKTLTEVGSRSPLAETVPRRHSALHVDFTTLYNLVLTARNEAMHQGAYARHLAQHAVELSLILEDAFMNRSNYVTDYMVKGPICAELWQPVSLIRQQMLTNSFSFLPVHVDGAGWRLVSDYGLAKLLRSSDDGVRAARLNATLKKAQDDFGLKVLEPIIASRDSTVAELLAKSGEKAGCPILVIEGDHLLGIVTPYDLL